MSKKKATKKVEAAEVEAAEVEEKKQDEKLFGKQITIEIDGHQYKGKCVSERKTNSDEQVFLQLNGIVSRWFSKKNIIEVD